LIVRAPGVAPARFAEPCALVDVAPTALAFIGRPTPACYRGIDLVAAARAGGPPRRPIVSETPRNLIQSSFYTWALVNWPHKVMWDVRSNTFEVFDLATDPGEQRNLVDREPALAERMRSELGAWLDRESARTRAAGPGDGALGE
jgi:arylsulfatase A-like enzyme